MSAVNFRLSKPGSRRLTLAYIFALCVLVGSATETVFGIRDEVASVASVEHSYRVLLHLETEFSDVNTLDGAFRAYLLTPNALNYTTFKEVAALLAKDEEQFKSMVADNPSALRSAARLEGLLEKREAEMTMVADLQRKGQPIASVIKTRGPIGRALRQGVRDQIESMNSAEKALLKDRLASSNRNAKIALAFFGLTSVSAILLLTGVYGLAVRLLASFADQQRRQAEYSARLEKEAELTAGAQRELERSNRELQDFAFVASHDLQEPLRKIQSYGERLRNRLGDTLDPTSERDLSRMRNAAERMQILINDILSLSRVSSKNQPFTQVSLNQIFDEVVDDLETRIQQTGATVTRGDLPTLDADAIQMRQLLQNLIGNALKFAKNDGSSAVRVTAIVAPKGFVGYQVQDNGIGFDEKYAEKIFTVFQRLHTRTEYEGTGVGLAICRRIVERHHGTIEARGVIDKGATFIVRLARKASR